MSRADPSRLVLGCQGTPATCNLFFGLFLPCSAAGTIGQLHAAMCISTAASACGVGTTYGRFNAMRHRSRRAPVCRPCVRSSSPLGTPTATARSRSQPRPPRCQCRLHCRCHHHTAAQPAHPSQTHSVPRTRTQKYKRRIQSEQEGPVVQGTSTTSARRGAPPGPPRYKGRQQKGKTRQQCNTERQKSKQQKSNLAE